MPKQRTRKAVAKRVKVTKSGKIRVNSPNGKHLLQQKSTRGKKKGKGGRSVTAPETHRKHFQKSLPHSV